MNRPTKLFYAFDSFRVDVTNRLLLRDEEPVSLTPKAFDMLLMLVQNSRRVLEKDELMNALWPDSIVEEANLTQTVYMLRKALGESSDGPKYIETIPKRGYRFVSAVNEIIDEETALIVEQHTRARVVIEEEEVEKEKGRRGEGEKGRREGRTTLASTVSPRQRWASRWAWLTAALALMMGAVIWFFVPNFISKSSIPPMKTTPLTSLKGIAHVRLHATKDENEVAQVSNLRHTLFSEEWRSARPFHPMAIKWRLSGLARRATTRTSTSKSSAPTPCSN